MDSSKILMEHATTFSSSVRYIKCSWGSRGAVSLQQLHRKVLGFAMKYLKNLETPWNNLLKLNLQPISGIKVQGLNYTESVVFKINSYCIRCRVRVQSKHPTPAFFTPSAMSIKSLAFQRCIIDTGLVFVAKVNQYIGDHKFELSHSDGGVRHSQPISVATEWQVFVE